MSNQEDGGKASTRGYQAQALVVLLDGLERTDWTSVAIEPERRKTNDESMQMVDIRWMKDEEVLRYDQVKYTKNQFTLGGVKTIARKMNSRMPNTAIPRHLFLVGNLGKNVSDDSTIEGVVIHANPPLERLKDVAAHCIDKCFPGFMPDVRETSVTKVSGILMANAGCSKIWTRPEFLSEIETQLRGTAEQVAQLRLTTENRGDIVTNTHFECLTILPEQGKHIAHYIVLSSTNTSPDRLPPQSTDIVFADTNIVYDTYLSPVPCNNEEGSAAATSKGNTTTISIPYGGSFEPGQTRTRGVYLKREIARISRYKRGSFSDPVAQTPTGLDFTWDITIILPYCCDVIDITPQPDFQSTRTIELPRLRPTGTPQENISVQYSSVREIDNSTIEKEERLKRLLMSKFRLRLNLPPEEGVSSDLPEVLTEIAMLRKRLAQ